jgi:hypothetical protein
LLDRKNQGKSNNTLLTARKQQIIHGLTIINPRKSYFDTDSRPSLRDT